MRAVAVLRALGPIDVLSVRRDPLLRWMLAIPILVALLFRWGLPPVLTWIEERFAIDPVPYHPLLVSMVVLITPMLFGTVIGFLLLDQKDDRTLSALQVTPLSLGGYLAYRLGVPLIVGIVMTFVSVKLTGLSTMGTGATLLAAVGGAPLVPAFALFLAAFARNKVQGFALMKASGVVNWPPVFAWFVQSEWQWAFGLCPTYWPTKLVWELEAGGNAALPAFLGGMLCLTFLIVLLVHRVDRVMHR